MRDEEEEYDFEYSDDDEAEPDVEVCRCVRSFGRVWGVGVGRSVLAVGVRG